MSTYTITTANAADGSVHVHKAGCADLKRSKAYKLHQDEQFELEVTCREEAREEYNADFDEETEGWYDLEWMPCASHVPTREELEIAENAEEAETRMPAKAKAKAKKAPAVETTIKVCGKWTRFYQNGVEVGRVHNDAADAVFAVIRQG